MHQSGGVDDARLREDRFPAPGPMHRRALKALLAHTACDGRKSRRPSHASMRSLTRSPTVSTVGDERGQRRTPRRDKHEYLLTACDQLLRQRHDHVLRARLSDTGIATVNGLVQGIIETRTRINRVHPIVFIRDNMFRGIQERDPDFCRNIEGQILRLYWSNQKLWEVIVGRLRIATGTTQEATEKVWNQCVEEELMGRDGFKQCLKRTLYRPRDILGLMQAALERSENSGKTRIGVQEVEQAAKEISGNRLRDMFKEYSALLPLLPTYTELWRNGDVQRSAQSLRQVIRTRLCPSSSPSSSWRSKDPCLVRIRVRGGVRSAHLRAMRSTDSSSVKASSPTAGTYARACHSSLTLKRSCLA